MKLPLSIHAGTNSLYLRDANGHYYAKGYSTDLAAMRDLEAIRNALNASGGHPVPPSQDEAEMALLLESALVYVERAQCEPKDGAVAADLSHAIRNALQAHLGRKHAAEEDHP